MSKMSKIHYMLENDFSDDKIAWYIFTNGRAGNWLKCKTIVREMRDSYETERKNISEEE